MKKMMMILVVLCGVLTLGGCGKKAVVPLMDASWEQIIEDGLGLSEKKFWGTFPADNRESWTKKEGEETGKIGSKSSLPYVQYEIPDGGTIAGEESGMTLRFYQDSGLGAVSWNGSKSGMDSEEMYTAVSGFYQTLKGALGDADDPSWEEWTDAGSFGAAMEKIAAQNPGQDFIWTANRWVTASRINDDPYDQYVSLTLMFNWPATGKADGNAEMQWTVSAVRDAS